MKKNTQMSSFFLLIIVGVFFISGCTNSIDELHGLDESEFFQEFKSAKFKNQQEELIFKTWQEKLDYVIDNPVEELIKNDLFLVSYKEIGTINSQADIERAQKAIFSEDAFALSIGNSWSDFSVAKVQEVKKFRSTTVESNFEKTENMVDFILMPGRTQVELTWRNGKDIFTTLCIVEGKNEIIYDNLLSNILVIREESYIEKNESSLVRLKSGSESDGQKLIWYSIWEIMRANYVYGEPGYSVSVHINVIGTAEGGKRIGSTTQLVSVPDRVYYGLMKYLEGSASVSCTSCTSQEASFVWEMSISDSGSKTTRTGDPTVTASMLHE